MLFRGRHIQRIRVKDFGLTGNQFVRHGVQCGIFLFGGQASDFPFRRSCGFQHFFHRRSSENVVPTVFPSRMS